MHTTRKTSVRCKGPGVGQDKVRNISVGVLNTEIFSAL